MRGNELLDKMAFIDQKFIEAAEIRPKKRKRPYLKWAAAAACFVLIAAAAIPAVLNRTSTRPENFDQSGTCPESLTVNGTEYVISPHLAVSDELPAGFAYAGEADLGFKETCPYYTDPSTPEWVYVYQEVYTDGTVDETGSLARTDAHNAYMRYVDSRLRGKDLICVDGNYYISMWSADAYGDTPDVIKEYYDSMKNAYGIRIEGSAPDGFVSAGTAEFSGYDTVPRGELASNNGKNEIFTNPAEPDVVLEATEWYTAPSGSSGEVKHTGFDVYIRYDCPF